ncbi:MAG: hypothetical protein ACPGVD_10365 [Flavobacteriales bacterium]
MKTKILKFSLLTAILGIALWSCKKDLNENTTNETPNNFFEYATSKKETVETNTQNLRQLGIKKIIVQPRTELSLDINVQSINNTFINGNSYALNNLTYTMSSQGNNYTLLSNSTGNSIIWNKDIDKLYLKEKGETFDFDLNAISEVYLKEIPVMMTIFDNFIKANISSFNYTHSDIEAEWVGTAVGMHKSRDNAEFFCNRDHEKILQNNPGWYSPGVSISCLWDNHVCICTADYYI